MKRWAASLVPMLSIVLAASVAAQADDDDAGAKARTSGVVARDSLAPGGTRPQAPYKMPPLSKALLDHMHNKLVHFPIVLTLVAAVMVIVARKKPQYEPIAYWLVWAAALSVIPAFFTGKAQEKHMYGGPKEWLDEIHEKQGIIIAITQAAWVLSLLKIQTRRYAWLIGLLLATMVLGSGFTGGLLAHGR